MAEDRLTQCNECQLLAKKLQIILESIPCSLVVTDPNGIVTHFNREMGDIIGRDRIGKHFNAAFPFDPVKQTMITLETGREFNGSVYRSTRSGKDHIIKTSTRRLYDDAGIFLGVLSFSTNITEQALLEQKIQVMQQLELLGELAASTAHEIRNPLTTIRGFLQLLEMDLAGDAIKSEYLQIMLDEMDTIETTISSFLDMARPHNPQFVPTEITSFLREIQPLLDNLARERSAELRLCDLSDHSLVEMDKRQIRQVLINMAMNANQALTVNAPGLIEIGAFTTVADIHRYLAPFAHYAQSKTFAFEPDSVCFTIRDNGSGIPPDKLHKLGTIFYSTKSTGTGIGLTVSQKIVSEHGGQLYYLSREGEGTVAIVKLPQVQRVPG